MPKPIRRSDRQNRDFLRRFFASRRGQDILREEQMQTDVPVGDINLIGEAEVAAQFEPRDETEASIYKKLGVQGVLDYRGMTDAVRSGRDQFAKDYLLPAALAMGAGPAARGAASLGAAAYPVVAPYASAFGQAMNMNIANVPGLTANNLLGAYGASDFVTNRAASIPANIREGNYLDAAVDVGVGALDIAGAGSLAKDIARTGGTALREGRNFFRIGGSKPKLSKVTPTEPVTPKVRDLDRVENVGVGLASSEPGRVGLLKRAGYKGPQINMGPRTQSPNELFEPSVLEPYSQRTDIAYTDAVAAEGSEFVRRYFADPQVQQHYRDLVGGGNPSFTNMKDAVNVMYDDAARIQSRQSLLGAPERTRVQEIAEKEFGGDYARMFQESEEASRLQAQYIEKLKSAGNVATDKVYQSLLHPDFDPERLTQTIIDNDDAVALEALFLRGQRTPDPIMSHGNEHIPGGAYGVYYSDLESVLMHTGARGNKSTAVHESQHFVDSQFLSSANAPGSDNPNAARKILNGISESVSPQYRDHVITNSSAQYSQDFNKYLANPSEITARTREAQRYLADVLLNNPTGNPAIANLSQKERVAFLLGDFSVLNESSVMNVFNAAFKNMAMDGKGGVIMMFNDIIDGGKAFNVPRLAPHRMTMDISGRKKDAISNLFKYSLATLGAGAAYGSMEGESQPSNSMAQGGMITMKKKRGGMSAIRK